MVLKDTEQHVYSSIGGSRVPVPSPTSSPRPSEAANSTPTGDSRIPRPSPTALRRSSSMRLRGERILHPRTAGSLATVSSPRQNHRRHGHVIQQTDTFPAITENGVASPRHRSFSLSLTPARPRLGNTAGGREQNYDDSDVDSVKSYGSACSTASACDHTNFGFNGTTWSGRLRKYVVHCSNYNGDDEQYLTPTQRAARQVRRLQTLLNETKHEIEEKDREILRLTKEVVELRLYKASLNSPDDRTDSSDAITVRENNPFSPDSPGKELPDEPVPGTVEKPSEAELPVSLADSGHFEDDSIHSKDSVLVDGVLDTVANLSNDARRKLVDHYENRIEEMHRRHVDELQELKQKHNDKVETLLNQLADVNTRYCELRPTLDKVEEQVKELEKELDSARQLLAEQKVLFDEQEERNKQMYLKMYAKGQEAAKIEQADQIFEQTRETSPKVTVPQLLQQLSVTQAELENVQGTSYLPQLHISAGRRECLLSAQEAVSLWVLATRKAMYRRIVQSRNSPAIDPEITLQFLKSAVYYFLTDKENLHGHLNAIESILGFTDNEKLNIDRIYGSSRK